MKPLVLFLILFLALAGMGTIWFIVKQSKCNLPDTSNCKSGSDGYEQLPYCATGTNTVSCGNATDICGKDIPADCQAPYCDWKSDKPTWKCTGTGAQKYNCSADGTTCVVDPNGKFSSKQDCFNSGCHSADQTCVPGTDGNLPYSVTDGTTVYSNFTKVPDQYGTYTFTQIGTENACLFASCSQGTLTSDKSGIWCDPSDDGTSCTSIQLKNNSAFPGDTYKGTYPDSNANYVLAYQNYINTTQYCKFDSCNQPEWKLNTTTNKCEDRCKGLDKYALTTDENCNILTCSGGYTPNKAQNACISGSGCNPIQFATAYDANCNPTACSDPTDTITVYGLDGTGKFCTGKSCTQPTGDFYSYTNTGTLGKCVKTNTCIPDSDPRKQYDPANNCNAICTGDSCKAFIGVPASDGFAFSCNSAVRSCTVIDDGTGWGGCGNEKFPQYGPKGDGTCGETVFEQRARFNDGTDTTLPMGCITCLGGQSGTACYPWETDDTKCSYAEGCTYGEAKQGGTPTDSLNECASTNSTYWGGYKFDNITQLPTGEQVYNYTNDGSASVVIEPTPDLFQQCTLKLDNNSYNFNPDTQFTQTYNGNIQTFDLSCDNTQILDVVGGYFKSMIWTPGTVPPQKSADIRISNIDLNNQRKLASVTMAIGDRIVYKIP
jgi:hypothetical protein